MKKNIIFICCLTLFLFATQSISVAFGLKGEKALKNHPEFVSIEEEWGEKLGTHYIVNLTENRILEFAQINSGNGGGKYAGLRRIGEFEVRGFVTFPKDKSIETHWKEQYGPHARFRDISQGMGVKIETMVDVIDHYDEIIDFFKMIAIEQYNTNKYVFRVDSEDRKAFIWVHQINGYYWYHWHGVKEDEFVGENFYGSENWREKVNNDLPKIRKSLGLE
ncbi:MAG: hypothetical protein PUF61_07255 [Spirochaetales bacterium]|nr:hypothetical protein [Spirochaetales bacterium]